MQVRILIHMEEIMKKIISMLLILCLACSLFVACTGTTEEEDTATTTKPTTTKRTTAPDEGNEDPLPEDITLLMESESEWKYNVVEVIYTSNDYIGRDSDGFADFVTANPNWMAPEFDDSEWSSKAAPFGDRISQANADAIGWTGDNHGLFLRTTFEMTQENIDKIASDDAYLYAWTWYDNTFYVYINGTLVYSHDDSELFVEGTDGAGTGAHDWNDAYEAIDFSDISDHYVYEGNVAALLKDGTNTIAVSLCDCWGGREFDLGLYVGFNS